MNSCVMKPSGGAISMLISIVLLASTGFSASAAFAAVGKSTLARKST